jgi:hypothetical protein
MKFIFKIIIHSLLLVVLATKLKAQSSAVSTTPQKLVPGWVSKRPTSILKYIGIGMAEKSNSSNYQNEAKKNALFDLSSEIKVNISSNSILHTVQNNSQFSENYNSMIQLSSSDNIEGFRLVDSYENDSQFWMYYELDKEEYENQKAQKKQSLIDKAVNLINLSADDENQKNFTNSIKKKLQAFTLLLPYFNEDIKFQSKTGLTSVLDLTNSIQKNLQAISIAAPKSYYTVKPYQNTYDNLKFDIAYNEKMPLKDFPFSVSLENDKIKLVNEKITTNLEGKTELSIKSVNLIENTVGITLSPDLNKLTENDSGSVFSVELLKKFIQIPELKSGLKIQPIQITVQTTEQNFSKFNDTKIIQQLILKKMNLPEVVLTETGLTADYIIECVSNTSKDISSDELNSKFGIQLAKLNLQLNLKNAKTNEIIYSGIADEIYGSGNSLDIAGMNAYNSEQLKIKLYEALFFLKRKLIVY